jgi:hypothetical protein
VRGGAGVDLAVNFEGGGGQGQGPSCEREGLEVEKGLAVNVEGEGWAVGASS